MLSDQDLYTSGTYEARGSGLAVAALLMGIALGAASALLLAPKLGPDLRARVAAAGGSWGDWKAQAADMLAQGREKIVAAVEDRINPPAHDAATGRKINEG